MKRKLLVVLFAVAAAIAAPAEVKDAGANGFTITHSFTVKGTTNEVFAKVVAVGSWWSNEHTYSGDARNMALEARPGGCWCEKLPAGGGVAHMHVATVIPGQLLVMSGGLGPLQQMGATGSMTFKLAQSAEGTTVTFTYAVSGYAPGGMNALAAPVDSVLMNAVGRLQSYIETGSAAKK